MKTEIRVVAFAAILAIVCSLLLTGAELLLKPYREANEQAEEMRNYLSALEIPVADDASAKDLVEIFNKNVSVQKAGDLEFYSYIPADSGGSPLAFAIPFTGAGLWGPVAGVLALEPDLETIRGIRFYKQEETPGLGGEIGADWFQDQFAGKQIISSTGEYGFGIVQPGGQPARNKVDGITGATMTSDRVGTMIDSVAKTVGKEMSGNVK